MTRKPDYAIASVKRSLDLIDALARLGPTPLGTLAREIGCTKTAAFRLLRTLEAQGYAVQTGSRGMWRLGARLGAIGRAVETQGALLVTATPLLRELALECNENVYLRVRDGGESELVAIERAKPPVRVLGTIGERKGLHTGPGLVLLAYAPARLSQAALGDRVAELARIRDRGWLVNTEPQMSGAVSLTVPVKDALGEISTALSIAAPGPRMLAPRPAELIALLLRTAEKLRLALGGAEGG